MVMGDEKEANGNNNNDGAKSSSSYNIFRDSLLRYCGYANEVGESFRYQFPKLVIPSYVVSFGYCLADATSTGYDTWNQFSSPTKGEGDVSLSSQQRNVQTFFSAFDVLLWQSLASVMIPGATINMIVKASRFAVARSPITLSSSIAKWAPTGIGLSSIPIIIHPIDHFVDYLLDNTTRPWIQNWTTATAPTKSSPQQKKEGNAEISKD